MSARHGIPRGGHGPIFPQAQWPALIPIPSVKDPTFAPKDEQRATDPPPASLIGPIVDPIQTGGRAILLADGVDVRGVTKRPNIGGLNRAREGRSWCAPAGQ